MTRIAKSAEMRTSFAFRERLESLIEKKEMKKSELPDLIGISKDVINRALLYAIVPSLQSLIKFADYFNVSIPYLLGESDDDDFEKSANPVSFRERLETLVQEKNTKYSVIAHKMTFPENYFYDWIRTNTRPSLDYLKEIARYFKVSVDYLLGRTDERS